VTKQGWRRAHRLKAYIIFFTAFHVQPGRVLEIGLL
jgi:hypothetical protein